MLCKNYKIYLFQISILFLGMSSFFLRGWCFFTNVFASWILISCICAIIWDVQTPIIIIIPRKFSIVLRKNTYWKVKNLKSAPNLIFWYPKDHYNEHISPRKSLIMGEQQEIHYNFAPRVKTFNEESTSVCVSS